MLKPIAFICCMYLCTSISWSQTTQIAFVLSEIEKNSKELQAYEALVESQTLSALSGNNLPDPHIGGYYLPFGEHNSSDYTELEISQSMEFPSVYSARKELYKQQAERLQLDYAKKRLEVLLPALKACLTLQYLYAQVKVEQERVDKARSVYEQVEDMYRAGQVGILEYNKARIAWMNDQFRIDHIRVDIQNELLSLKKMNGGEALAFVTDSAEMVLTLPDKESLWQEKLQKMPELQTFQLEEQIAQQQLLVSKRKALPNLTLGYNYQGVQHVNYHGVYGGLTIPLWSSKNKVKSAQTQLDYRVTIKESGLASAYANYESQYNEYQHLLEKYNLYASSLGELNSEDLLFESYELGEISFSTYYAEIQFYHEAVDTKLDLQRQLMLARAALLEHEL